MRSFAVCDRPRPSRRYEALGPHTAETYSHLQLSGAVKWLGLLER
jgi:hypothetical protein